MWLSVSHCSERERDGGGGGGGEEGEIGKRERNLLSGVHGLNSRMKCV